MYCSNDSFLHGIRKYIRILCLTRAYTVTFKIKCGRRENNTDLLVNARVDDFFDSIVDVPRLNHWGFLFKEGIITEDFIERLWSPWHIINFWETFGSLLLNERETMGNTKLFSDFEYLYNAMKKKYPNLSSDTKFAFRMWRDEELK